MNPRLGGHPSGRPSSRSVPAVVAVASGVLLVTTGVWAFSAPRSFYRVIAEYPPYNEHFLHDIGAFLAGLGAALIVIGFITDALAVALLGNAVAAALHTVSHI